MNINFFEDYHICVELEISNESYEGELIIEEGFVSRLEVKTDYINSMCLSNQIDFNALTCKEKYGARTFTLHDISYDRGVFFFNFLTTGDVDISEYREIKIGLTGITTWFEANSPAKLNDKVLIKDVHLEEFCADFMYERDRYNIKNTRDIRFKEINKEKYSLEIEDFILIESSKKLTFDKLKDISCRIETLFSILTGAALSITSISLIDRDRERNVSLFFDCVNYEKIPLKYGYYAFSNFYQINKKNMWGDILNNFFSKKILKIVGDKIPHLIGSCFNAWEYEVLAVIAVLEKCCNLLCDGKSHKLGGKDFDNLRNNILTNFDEYVKDFPELDKNVIDSIREGIYNVKNTSIVSAGDKINNFIKSIPCEIREIINFDKKYIDMAKNIRNAIAHGEVYESEIKGAVDKEFILKNKSIVVLIYCLFKELGFDDKLFVESLSTSRNDFLRRADLNRRAVDKFLGDVDFIDVVGGLDSNIDFKKYIFIVLDLIDGDFYINSRMTNCIHSDFNGGKISSVKDFVKEKVDHEKYTVDYSVNPYITINGEEKRWHGAVLIKKK